MQTATARKGPTCCDDIGSMHVHLVEVEHGEDDGESSEGKSHNEPHALGPRALTGTAARRPVRGTALRAHDFGREEREAMELLSKAATTNLTAGRLRARRPHRFLGGFLVFSEQQDAVDDVDAEEENAERPPWVATADRQSPPGWRRGRR